MKTIAFVNMKGGVGKTTLAVNVADALNRRHDQQVLLVDLDPQFNATQCLFGGEEYVARRAAGGHTIVDVFNDTPGPSISPVKGPIVKSALKLDDIKPWSVREGFDIIPGDLEIYRIDMGSGQGKELRLKRYLERVARKLTHPLILRRQFSG